MRQLRAIFNITLSLFIVLVVDSCALFTPKRVCTPTTREYLPFSDINLPEDNGICDIAAAYYPCNKFIQRCSASDPRCRPEPVADSESCYDPRSSRNLLPSGGSKFDGSGNERDRRSWRGIPGNGCEHDGECRILGCYQNCEHFRRLGLSASSCERFYVLPPESVDNLFCGCVSGECSYFTQE